LPTEQEAEGGQGEFNQRLGVEIRTAKGRRPSKRGPDDELKRCEHPSGDRAASELGDPARKRSTATKRRVLEGAANRLSLTPPPRRDHARGYRAWSSQRRPAEAERSTTSSVQKQRKNQSQESCARTQRRGRRNARRYNSIGRNAGGKSTRVQHETSSGRYRAEEIALWGSELQRNPTTTALLVAMAPKTAAS